MWYRQDARGRNEWTGWAWTDLSFNELLAVRVAVRRAFMACRAECAKASPVRQKIAFPAELVPAVFVANAVERFGMRVDLSNIWLYVLKTEVANGSYDEGPVWPYKIFKSEFRLT